MGKGPYTLGKRRLGWVAVLVAGPSAIPALTPLVSGVYRWARVDAALHDAADIAWPQPGYAADGRAHRRCR